MNQLLGLLIDGYRHADDEPKIILDVLEFQTGVLSNPEKAFLSPEKLNNLSGTMNQKALFRWLTGLEESQREEVCGKMGIVNELLKENILPNSDYPTEPVYYRITDLKLLSANRDYIRILKL